MDKRLSLPLWVSQAHGFHPGRTGAVKVACPEALSDLDNVIVIRYTISI